MFPDGNGGFARLMVKTLIPDAIAGPRTVDAVWQNRVNFRALDRTGQATRLRLNCTVVRVEHAGDPSSASTIVVTYAKGNRLNYGADHQGALRPARPLDRRAGKPGTRAAARHLVRAI